MHLASYISRKRDNQSEQSTLHLVKISTKPGLSVLHLAKLSTKRKDISRKINNQKGHSALHLAKISTKRNKQKGQSALSLDKNAIFDAGQSTSKSISTF